MWNRKTTSPPVWSVLKKILSSHLNKHHRQHPLPIQLHLGSSISVDRTYARARTHIRALLASSSIDPQLNHQAGWCACRITRSNPATWPLPRAVAWLAECWYGPGGTFTRCSQNSQLHLKKSDASEIKIGRQISHGAHRKSTRDSSWTVARFPRCHGCSWLGVYLGWYSDRGRLRWGTLHRSAEGHLPWAASSCFTHTTVTAGIAVVLKAKIEKKNSWSYANLI